MRHGYTNHTELRGDVVRKTYSGPSARTRCAAEVRALTQLSGQIPVPAVVSSGPTWLDTAYVAGRHGQDLIETGPVEEVLAACGALLRLVHGLNPEMVGAANDGEDGPIRHGDFGPNNVLFDPDTMVVTALLDWEFSGRGPVIHDIAWCEWIVRFHHKGAVGALPAFFDAYGSTPPWNERHRAMLDRCKWLEDFCERWNPGGPGALQWRARGIETAGWHS